MFLSRICSSGDEVVHPSYGWKKIHQPSVQMQGTYASRGVSIATAVLTCAGGLLACFCNSS